MYPLRLLAGLATAVGIVTLALAHGYNVLKPTGLAGGPAVWQMSRTEAQTLASPTLDASLTALDRRVPANARVAVVFGGNEWDYPLYGSHLERRVSEFTSVRSAERSNPQWLVLGTGVPAPPDREWKPQPLANGWTLLSRSSTRTVAASLIRSR